MGGASFAWKETTEQEIEDAKKEKDPASLITKPLTYVINMSLSEEVILTEWKVHR